MAYLECCKAITAVAASDLSGKIYYFGVFNSSGKLTASSTAGGEVDGIIGHAADGADRAATLVVPDGGVAMVISGAAVTAGSKVMSGSAGKAITAASSGSKIWGVALEAASASDQVIAIQFTYKGDVS